MIHKIAVQNDRGETVPEGTYNSETNTYRNVVTPEGFLRVLSSFGIRKGTITALKKLGNESTIMEIAVVDTFAARNLLCGLRTSFAFFLVNAEYSTEYDPRGRYYLPTSKWENATNEPIPLEFL